jgi:hypothetical protein
MLSVAVSRRIPVNIFAVFARHEGDSGTENEGS